MQIAKWSEFMRNSVLVLMKQQINIRFMVITAEIRHQNICEMPRERSYHEY